MHSSEFKKQARNLLGRTAFDRVSPLVKQVLERGNYVFDCHVHIFDKKSINEWYWALRILDEKVQNSSRPKIKLPGDEQRRKKIREKVQQELEQVYQNMRDGKKAPSWESVWNERKRRLMGKIDEKLKETKLGQKHKGGIVSLIPVLFATTKMEDILVDFLEKKALTNLKRFEGKDLISAILMLDYGKTWNGEVDKTMVEQVDEIKDIARKYPILPFLSIDPRRVEDEKAKAIYIDYFCELLKGKMHLFLA